tara:strand:- start:405 stop:734 length:330 start_codon:yes stop_codon:yes gene_type:complete
MLKIFMEDFKTTEELEEYLANNNYIDGTPCTWIPNREEHEREQRFNEKYETLYTESVEESVYYFYRCYEFDPDGQRLPLHKGTEKNTVARTSYRNRITGEITLFKPYVK